jgi:hypothetical protein
MENFMNLGSQKFYMLELAQALWLLRVQRAEALLREMADAGAGREQIYELDTLLRLVEVTDSAISHLKNESALFGLKPHTKVLLQRAGILPLEGAPREPIVRDYHVANGFRRRDVQDRLEAERARLQGD